MKSREYVEALKRDLLHYGATDVRITSGGAHPHIKFNYDGREMMIPFPASPSDGRRGLMNALTGLRKKLGVKKTKSALQLPANKKHHKNANRASLSPVLPETLTVFSDPFACLDDLFTS